MKNMKKIGAIALAMVLALALCVPALAAGNGSITINNAIGGKEFIVCRIFDLSLQSGTSGDTAVVAYTINSEWTEFFTTGAGSSYIINENNADKTLSPIIVDGVEKFINISESNVAEFANVAQGNITNVTGTTVTVPEGETSVTVDGLDLGYYLVFPKGAEGASNGNGSMCSLTSTVPNGEVNVKAEYPTITKDVDDKDQTVTVGQILTYTITGKVPDYTAYETYTYKVSDHMSDGLTFNKDVTVMVGGTDVTDACIVDNTTDSNGFSVTIPVLNNKYEIGADIEITYTATVNDKAVVKIAETNSATLVYSNNPSNSEETSPTPPVIIKVYTYGFDLFKYAAGDDTTALDGAEFTLALKDSTTNIEFIKTETGYRVATAEEKADVNIETTTTLVAGNITITGLEAGKYVLTETKAPSGYNKLTAPIEFTIDALKDSTSGELTGEWTVSDSNGALEGGILKVENNAGAQLPSTGGIGTTIFYVVGGILVVGAVILLVTRKRVSDEV